MTYGFDQRDGIDLISTPYITPAENLPACAYQAHLRIRTPNLPVSLKQCFHFFFSKISKYQGIHFLY